MDNNVVQSSFASKVLELHFKYVNTVVDCSVVKRFLPLMADQDVSISIPTPITVHIEHCQQCQKDLKYLSGLELRKDQLYVLSQIFTEKDSSIETDCKDIEAEIKSFSTMDFSPVSEKTAKHICFCSDCRNKIIEKRLLIIEKTDQENPLFCNFSKVDLFETCFPYSRLPQSVPGKSAEDIQHIASCPKCLQETTELLTNIGEISDRENSKITTKFTLKSQTDNEINGSAGYEEWPIDVKVFTEKPQNKPASKFRHLKLDKYYTLLDKAIKPLGIAAAIVLVCTLFLNGKTAQAVTLKEMLAALDNMRSVCAKQYLGDKLIQTTLKSREKGIIILKDAEKTVLFDVNTGNRSIYFEDTGQITTSPMNQELKERINSKLYESWEFIPSSEENTTWKDVTNQIQNISKGFAVYELNISDVSGKKIIFTMRFWINTNNNLPYYSKSFHRQNNQTMVEGSNYEFSYDQQAEIETTLQKLSLLK